MKFIFLIISFLLLIIRPIFANVSVNIDSIQKISSGILSKEKKAIFLNKEAEKCWRFGEYDKGLLIIEDALLIAKSIKNKKEEGKAYLTKGILFDFLGDYDKSLHNYLKALKIQLKIKDLNGLADTYNNLGLLYTNQEKFEKATEYHVKALAIFNKLENQQGISIASNNLGIIYMAQNKLNLALKNYLSTIDFDKKQNNLFGLADSYNNIGLIYMKMGDFSKSEDYFQKSLSLRRKTKDINGIGNSYNNLGSLYYKKGDKERASDYFSKAIEIGKKIKAKILIEYAYDNLSILAEENGDYKKALDYYIKYIGYRDSIINENVLKNQTKDELQYVFDLKVAKEMHKHKAIEMANENKIQRQRFVIISSITLIGFVLIFSVIFIRKWKFEKKQNLIIEQQKALVESKNQEILASITYAKRIQSAILPPEKLVKNYLANSFILYLPKDIVAGDFYWIEPVENSIIFAVADCTGHGVPGAMMSVVCHNALNRSVREFGLNDPGEILDKTRSIIIGEFEKSEDNVSDGMDISLCHLNFDTNELKWAGANNPLWFIKKETHEIIEVKATKQPIGKYDCYDAFKTHVFQLEKDDILYLFTDGMADQFGGTENKKFKANRMKELILSMRDLSMLEQRCKFLEAFEKWKKNQEQIDDVCVIGLKI